MCTFGYLDSKVNGLKNLKILFLKDFFLFNVKIKIHNHHGQSKQREISQRANENTT